MNNYDLSLENQNTNNTINRKLLQNFFKKSNVKTEFIDDLLKNKLLTIRAGENVIRILPPLNLNKKEINMALKIINKVCNSYKIN